MQPVVVEEDAVAQVGNANRPDQVERKLAEFSQVVPDCKHFKFTIILSDCAKLSQGFLLLMMEFRKRLVETPSGILSHFQMYLNLNPCFTTP